MERKGKDLLLGWKLLPGATIGPLLGCNSSPGAPGGGGKEEEQYEQTQVLTL